MKRTSNRLNIVATIFVLVMVSVFFISNTAIQVNIDVPKNKVSSDEKQYHGMLSASSSGGAYDNDYSSSTGTDGGSGGSSGGPIPVKEQEEDKGRSAKFHSMISGTDNSYTGNGGDSTSTGSGSTIPVLKDKLPKWHGMLSGSGVTTGNGPPGLKK
ncbi:amy family lysozyme-like protein [Tieghemostelium lacteum]|uniref:Amy family lysozyme-like protein n=1 Tax=Tieghemostelium lacteum TaxID=361077 RepID=A0A152A5N3_TIELA|nr:amy family lysozyme-like protein [Tieghemostelium lacteum]|eukprot:KYR01387.1 amy family lysozyme-like protein [Tieghemostelium lacteum]